MGSLQNHVIESINKFLTDQRKIQEPCTVTLSIFDDKFDTLDRMQRLEKVADLTAETYRPRGMTALREALCREIDATGRDLEALPASYRPDKVVVVVMTDGAENASSPAFTVEALRDRITRQTDVYKWEFVYLGANQDSFATSNQYGFAGAYTSNYVNTKTGLGATYSVLSSKLGMMRSAVDPAANMAFTIEEQDALNKGEVADSNTDSGV